MIRPILFNTNMVQSILDDRKTATRRVIKFPTNCFTGKIPIADNVKVHKNTLRSEKVNFSEEPFYGFDVKPPYRLGDILYVRETWHKYTKRVGYGECCRLEEFYGYKASIANSEDADEKWCPSIHMPKEAARIWLKITNVKVERLQDMTLDDFLNEGISIPDEAFNDPENAYMQSKKLFINIWDSTLNKEKHDLYRWNANPWVWVIKFKRCEKPEEWCV